MALKPTNTLKRAEEIEKVGLGGRCSKIKKMCYCVNNEKTMIEDIEPRSLLLVKSKQPV